MSEVSLSREKLVDMYRKMWLARHHDVWVEDMKTKGQIMGSMHLATGQEAVSVGACAPLNDDDYTMHTHREHQQLIAKGADIGKMAGDMLGKVTGCARGKGGHMLLFDKDVHALGACGIVGGGVPVAVGYAMAFKVLGTKQVALTFFGDGAANEGSVHEAMNFAAVRNVPHHLPLREQPLGPDLSPARAGRCRGPGGPGPGLRDTRRHGERERCACRLRGGEAGCRPGPRRRRSLDGRVPDLEDARHGFWGHHGICPERIP